MQHNGMSKIKIALNIIWWGGGGGGPLLADFRFSQGVVEPASERRGMSSLKGPRNDIFRG
jgi:hypothetical protein